MSKIGIPSYSNPVWISDSTSIGIPSYSNPILVTSLMPCEFKLSFSFELASGYPIIFYALKEGVYPLFFYGVPIIELVIYTHKYITAVKEKGIFLKKLLLGEVLSENEISLIDLFFADQYYKEEIYILLGKKANVRISIQKIIKVFAESKIDIKLHEKKGLTPLDIEEIVSSTEKFVEFIVKKESNSYLWKCIETLSEVALWNCKHLIVYPGTCSKISLVGIELENRTDISISNPKNSNVIVNTDKGKIKSVNVRSEGGKKRVINVNAVSEIENRTIIITEQINIKEILEEHRRYYENDLVTDIKESKFTSAEFNTGIKIINKIKSNKGIAGIIMESITNSSKYSENFISELQKQSSSKSVSTTPDEGIIDSSIKSIDQDFKVDAYNYIRPYTENIIQTSSIKGKNTDLVIETGLFEKISTENLLEVDDNIVSIAEVYIKPEIGTGLCEKINVENLLEVDDNIVSIAEVYIKPEIGIKGYRDVRFGRRWRLKSGEAFDKIWLNPISDGFLFDDELTKEAKISFKAMLDFILFLEQLILNNRYFYKDVNTEMSLNDMERILEEWLTESRPEEDPSEEHESLYRWYKWFADGKRNQYLNNTTVRGEQALIEIKDKMVEYFETRWGERVTIYGVDGMYKDSKDYSYIDRLRGKKHGVAGNTVDRKDMIDEYGIDDKNLTYDVDNDVKGKREP